MCFWYLLVIIIDFGFLERFLKVVKDFVWKFKKYIVKVLVSFGVLFDFFFREIYNF